MSDKEPSNTQDHVSFSDSRRHAKTEMRLDELELRVSEGWLNDFQVQEISKLKSQIGNLTEKISELENRPTTNQRNESGSISPWTDPVTKTEYCFMPGAGIRYKLGNSWEKFETQTPLIRRIAELEQQLKGKIKVR